VREGAVTIRSTIHQAGNEIIFTTDFDGQRRGKIVPAHVIAPDELPDGEYPMVLSTAVCLNIGTPAR